MLGHLFVWYQSNMQFVWEYWADKPLLSTLLFGIPAGIAFWYGMKFSMVVTNELWSARFLAFALSYTIFPILTWWYLNESFFTFKTLICTFLAFLIILIQLYFD